MRKLWLQRTPACLATGGAKPHEHCLHGRRAHLAPCRWRDHRKVAASLHHDNQTALRCLLTIWGIFRPSHTSFGLSTHAC